MSDTKKISAPKNRAPTLWFIVGVKLIKAAALLAVAVWFFILARREEDLPDLFDQFIRWIHLDPENRFFNNISDWLATITPGNVRAVALATFLYALFLLVGGTGLALRAKWAIWLAIGESAFFIPIEIFELVRRRAPQVADSTEQLPPQLFHHPKIGILIVLALNVLIVCYLLKNRQRLFRHHS